MTQPVLILGATSSIARETAIALAKRGHSLYLAGRDQSELNKIAADIQIRYQVDTKYGLFDADQFEQHSPFFQKVVSEMGTLDGMVIAFGDMGEHAMATQNFREAQKIFNRNFIGPCSILTEAGNYFAMKESGFIVGISSVSGDRGRQSNYIYGAAKGGLSLFLQGLRNRLNPFNVKVLTVKPGFVDTAMTFGKEGLFLVASPNYVGEKVVKAVEKGKDVIYVPWFWRYIMLIIKSIPEKIFKKLKL